MELPNTSQHGVQIQNLPADGNQYRYDPEAIISARAQSVLRTHPEMLPTLNSALAELRTFFATKITIYIDQFTDPYDGSKMLMVTLDAPLPYIEASEVIDRFCEKWYESVSKLPVWIVFQAGD